MTFALRMKSTQRHLDRKLWDVKSGRGLVERDLGPLHSYLHGLQGLACRTQAVPECTVQISGEVRQSGRGKEHETAGVKLRKKAVHGGKATPPVHNLRGHFSSPNEIDMTR